MAREFPWFTTFLISPGAILRRRGSRWGGASFGGWHAMNLAFRHPGAVSHATSTSAGFDMTSFVDGYYDENFYYNNLFDYMAHCTNPWKYNHMGIILGTGEWDHCRSDNFRLSGLLESKGINTFSTIGSGPATNGVTGKILSRITYRSYRNPRALAV